MGFKTFLVQKVGRLIPDKIYIQIKFFQYFHRFADLKNPKTFNEKLQWLKLYDRKPIYTTMVDKYASKKYVADRIGDEYVIPCVAGPWKSADEIDFDALPDRFVLKTNHDCGGVVICKDKNSFDREKAKEKLAVHLKRDYYIENREWPYKNVQRCIFAEQYMEDTKTAELRDYKFFCFDGEVKAMFIAADRASKTEETKFDFFDENYNHLPFTNGHPNASTLPEKPEKFELMKELASKLSAGIPHLRVDFYEVDGKVYFGELTFFHWSGFVPFEPQQWDYTFGSWIDLESVEKEDTK